MEDLENLGAFLDNCGDVIVDGRNPRLSYRGRLTRNLELERGHCNRTYAFFVGIPYAMPAVGTRRFKPPEPYETTETMYDALTCKPACKQYDSRNVTIFGSEDCLYLNLYLSKKPQKGHRLLPVLVFFHGGGMRRGSGNYRDVTPDSIMKEDLIFVTVNYRLGVFGFLNMHTEFCRGNQGLKDQVMALHWIKDNIEAFGGNPKNVTICGQSSGGSCVNLHLISPLSRGLFHKAIVMSGGIHTPWGFTGHLRESMLNYKQAVDSLNTSRDEVLNSMKKLSANELLELDHKISKEKLIHDHRMRIHLGASIENSSEGAFLPPCENIQELVDTAKPVPILAGICTKEGYMIQEGDMSWLKDRENFVKFLMVNLRWSRESATKLGDDLSRNYMEESLWTEQGALGFDIYVREFIADFCTDLSFYNFYKNFEFRGNGKNKSTPFYVYLFDFLDDTISSSYEHLDYPKGAAHGDDLNYLFCSWQTRKSLMGSKFHKKFLKRSKTMCHLWASFCKSSVPKARRVKWKPHTDKKPRYLYINNEKIKMKDGEMFSDRWHYMRRIITSEQIIPSLPTTPRTPRARRSGSQKAAQAKQGPSSPRRNVTEEESSNQQNPQSLEPGPATGEDNQDQQIPQAPEPGPAIGEDELD